MQMPIEKNESSFAGLLLIGSLALGALELGAGVNGLMGSSGRGGEHNSGATLYCGGHCRETGRRTVGQRRLELPIWHQLSHFEV